MNRATLLGYLGSTPECRTTTSGTLVANLRVATTERWKDASGEAKEKTEWHSITAFGKLAENCQRYLDKGSQVLVEGRLETSSYDDKEGVKRYSTKIIASTVQFLGRPSKAEDEGDSEKANTDSASADADTNTRAKASGNARDTSLPLHTDEIPF